MIIFIVIPMISNKDKSKFREYNCKICEITRQKYVPQFL